MIIALWPGNPDQLGSDFMLPFIRKIYWKLIITVENGNLEIVFPENNCHRLIQPGDPIIINDDGTYYKNLNYLPKVKTH